jgi:hypothetical protein
MKLPPLLLAGSLAANLALFGALAWQPALAPPFARDFFARNFHAAEPPAAPAPAIHAPPPEKIKLWTAFATDDLATLVARLRAAGFPPEIIRAIIQAQLNARYDARIRALRDPDPNTPFWKLPSSYSMVGSTSKRWEEISQLQRERAKLSRELLGDDFFATNDVTTEQRRQFGDLTRAKIDAVQRIEDDYAEMNSAIRAAMKGITLPEDRDKFALLTREKHADLAAILTPEELADYEVRSSPITQMLRYQLNGFDASEAEYRAIYQMQQAYGEKFPYNGSFGGGDYQQRQATLEQLNNQLKTALGDTRFADYSRETSYEYQQLKRLTERDNLPADTAVRAYAMRDNVAQQSTRIFDDTALTADQKRAALQSLAQDTRAQLLATLGPTVGPAYVKTADNQWLNIVERGAAVKFTGTSMTIGNGNASIVFSGGPDFRNLPPATPPHP